MTKPTVSPQQSPERTVQEINQSAQNVGKNSMQVAGNYSNQQTLSLNLMISVFFISIVALGGLAWTLNVGPNSTGNSTQTGQSPNTTQVEE